MRGDLRPDLPPSIIAVEDCEHDRRALLRASDKLEVAHLLQVFPTAEELIAALENLKCNAGLTRPGLFLLDLELPGMSCAGLIDAIRTDPHWDGMKIFVFSGYNGPEAMEAGLNPRIDGFFAKKQGTQSVLQVLRACIHAANQTDVNGGGLCSGRELGSRPHDSD